MVDTTDEWITTRTGIKARRILKEPGKASSFMGVKAAENLLEKTGVNPAEIDVVICATVTPDMTFPDTAYTIDTEIGAYNASEFDPATSFSVFFFALTS